ncbi:uncharacterized protein LOC102803921 [Saccoglossus kowalevskii]|uniref:Leucine-rich PPR motif-containing protein, mitochondrial-like n=1 Tax=Saccoglossus kowalevskii TaxID=10224 RepID=A0ABM0M6H9_SACKO|nr:PREDICTED: leucine-rich PPR motif-containing protein, mitochondrial-like [Saccoglossus kowalevskii]
MAFLRRSARIARYLAASPQNCVRTVIRPNQRLFVVVEHNARQAFHSSSRLTNTETAVSHSAIDDDFGDFIKNIQHQEHDIFHQVVFSEKRFGRVTKLQVTRMFDSLCKTGFATARTVQQLTRYCGSLMAEVPAIERTKLVHEIWDKVEDLGMYATYKKLVGLHCQQGDMEGARRVLEIMKSEDMPVTNTVFRYLIMGHARAGDMESAKGILDQMRSVSLEPSVKTHVALMCAYAEKGDIDNIREILTNLKTEGNAVPSIYLLSVIHSLAASGNKQHIQEILDQISFESLSQPDIINLCITLITEEHDDVAFEILKPHLKESQQKMNLVEGQESQKANFFIRQIVKLERDFCHLPWEFFFA